MAMSGGQLVVMPGGTDAPGVIEDRTQDTAGPPVAAVVMEDLLPGEHVAQQRWSVQRRARRYVRDSLIKPSRAF